MRELGKTCEANPFCETIKCYFCKARITNAHCFPRWAMILVLIMVYFGLSSLYLALSVCKLLAKPTWRLLKCLWFLLKAVLKRSLYLVYSCLTFCCTSWFKSRQHPTSMLPTVYKGTAEPAKKRTALPSYRKQKKDSFVFQAEKSSLYIISFVIFLMCQAPVLESCSEATVLTATTKQCHLETKSRVPVNRCEFHETTRIALVPEGQDTCLNIQDQIGNSLGVVKVRMHQISLNCQMHSEYFTRDFTIKLISHKRCPNAGSCSGDKCHAININSKIPELSGESEHFPGKTYCVESSGCWAQGCFYCTAACLFFRYYAYPRSNVVYEVQTCPIWNLEVKATLLIELLTGKTLSTEVILHPGVKLSWKNMDFTLIGVVQPPAPILTTSFISNGQKTAIISTAPSEFPISGLIGSLQCKNREAASKFDCFIARDLCTCHPQEDRIGCDCVTNSIERIFKQEQRVLPLKMQGLLLQSSNNKLTASYNSLASLEVQITMKNTSLVHIQQNTKCHITVNSFRGCYSCLTGAELSYKCTTDSTTELSAVLATIVCADSNAKFSTKCNAEGILGKTSLSFSKANIAINCIVDCSGGSTTFELNGTLVYIDKEPLSNNTNVIPDVRGSNEINFPDLGFLSNLLGGKLGIFLLIIGGIILFVLTFPLLRGLSEQLGQTLQNLKLRMQRRWKK